MSVWLVNDAMPSAAGLEVIGGSFRTGSASTVQLAAARDFDASQLYSYDGDVVIKRDGDVFFRGKVRAIPKNGSAATEGHDYLVEDAWAELERTTYQEPWKVNGGTVLMPRAFLGVNSAGVRIRLDQQITEALDFAIDAGVDLQIGSIPTTGMLLWPSEVDGMSCAEVIRQSLRYHPDWIPWIDHSTSPPTFNVTPRASADGLPLAVTDLTDFDVTETQDRMPSCVRICFVTANTVDDEIYRSVSVQKYPTDGPDSGPGVLAITVDLQGVQMSIQKQQVQTRTIPEDASTAKAYLKAKFPAIADLADTDFTVDAWDREVIAETETPPDPINPNATRLVGTTLTDLPRELFRGTVAEWMRKKVGAVRLTWTITPTGTASEADIEKLSRIPSGATVTSTNAVTKIYKGISSFIPGEDAPAGIAEAYYNTIRNACQFEGTATLVTSALTGRWHGKKLNLSGGVSAWASMGAPIHSISWDAESEEASIQFGPNPYYAAQDFIEYAKLLRKRPVNWITTNERDSSEMGDDSGASSAGDIVGPFDEPESVPEYKPGSGEAFVHPWKLTTSLDGETMKFKVSSAHSGITDGTNGSAIDISGAGLDVDVTISAEKYIVLEASVDASLVLTSWTLVAAALADADEVKIVDNAQTKLRLLIGKVTVGDGVATPWQALYSSVRIVNGVLNGTAVKVFAHASTHPSEI